MQSRGDLSGGFKPTRANLSHLAALGVLLALAAAALHHFWVGDPFYRRQATAPVAHRVFREYGIRFSYLDTFRRGNRYHAAAG